MSLQILQLKSRRTDNTFYLAHDGEQACLIDPIDPQLAIEHITRLGLKPSILLNTHWHPDHVGGNAAIFAAYPHIAHMLPAAEADDIDSTGAAAVIALTEGQIVQLGAEQLEVRATPGHTHGHISLVGADVLLCGDTIFSAGVGHCKLGGHAPTLAHTLRHVLSELPDHLRVLCGHDYARKNIAFARSLLPEDAALRAHQARLEAHGPTPLITTLGEERAINLFMRCGEDAVQQAAQARSAETFEARCAEGDDLQIATFCALRAARDVW